MTAGRCLSQFGGQDLWPGGVPKRQRRYLADGRLSASPRIRDVRCLEGRRDCCDGWVPRPKCRSMVASGRSTLGVMPAVGELVRWATGALMIPPPLNTNSIEAIMTSPHDLPFPEQGLVDAFPDRARRSSLARFLRRHLRRSGGVGGEPGHRQDRQQLDHHESGLRPDPGQTRCHPGSPRAW